MHQSRLEHIVVQAFTCCKSYSIRCLLMYFDTIFNIFNYHLLCFLLLFVFNSNKHDCGTWAPLLQLVTVELQWLEHWWLVYHGYFELVLESLGKNPLAADLGWFSVIFFFILKTVNCVYSLESPHWGDSNENTQHTFIW